MARKITPESGRSALAAWKVDPDPVRNRRNLATAVRYIAGIIEAEHPGRSVELRVPPFAAVQCVEGTVHTRGTPPAVVELSPEVLLDLATGMLTWRQAFEQGKIAASGNRADLSEFFPLPEASASS